MEALYFSAMRNMVLDRVSFHELPSNGHSNALWGGNLVVNVSRNTKKSSRRKDNTFKNIIETKLKLKKIQLSGQLIINDSQM
ncbi:MAG: hypothetical protein BWY72_01435 [Bacteroidetes bacterium ADurb.Bin416]|nr:MAG: hypothetical protein BWY72_01435 [Bacteroidetes bacterium ADurb.Bin416]